MNSGDTGGPIGYMVRNRVAANLLALLIVGAGFFSLNGIVQEAFPSVTFDAVEITVDYPGAAPASPSTYGPRATTARSAPATVPGCWPAAATPAPAG